MGTVSFDEFLAARYAERQALAEAAGAPRHRRCDYAWSQTDPVRQPGLIGDGCGDVVTYDEGSPTQAQAAHIAAYDPAWALADIAVKRAILAEHPRKLWFENADTSFWDVTAEQKAEALAKASCARCHAVIDDAEPDEDRCAEFDYPCPTVRQLGSEFAAHADYQREWAPQ